MLDLAKSTLVDTRVYPVHSSVLALEEGTALTFVIENGVAKVKPTAGGSATEPFAGVSMSKHALPTAHNIVVESAVPSASPYTVALAKTPISAGNVTAYIDGTKGTQGTPAAGVYSVTGNVLTFHSSDATKHLKILYKANLSQAEANMIYGGDAIGSNLMDDVEISAVSAGIVFTDKFVMSDSWETSMGPIYLGANGLFTLTAGSNALIDAVVVAIPSASNGLLGISLKP